MVRFADFSTPENIHVNTIIDRAMAMGIYDDPLECDMDISATHATCPLNLVALAMADRFNFAHDVAGIKRNINRTTGRLDNCFLPRFAQPERG